MYFELVAALLLLLLYALYTNLIAPALYWRRKRIFHVQPWTRLWQVFATSAPFTDLVRSAYAAHPTRRYYGSYQFLRPSLFVRDLALIRRITTQDFDRFTDRAGLASARTDPLLGLSLFALGGRRWREMRATLSPAFTASKMRLMYALIGASARDFTRSLREPAAGGVETKQLFEAYANDVIANCAFGVELNTLREPDNDLYRMGRAVSAPSPWRNAKRVLHGLFPLAFELLRVPLLPAEIGGFFLALIRRTVAVRERGALSRPDMVHLMMEARRGRLAAAAGDSGKEAGFATVEEAGGRQLKRLEITDELMTAQALVFFIAGFTTVSSVLSFLAYELAVNPDVQRKLQAEIDRNFNEGNEVPYEAIAAMKYLDQVVSEALRKWPPAFALTRVCTEEYVIEPELADEGVLRLDKGCLVLIPAIALHYSEEFFPDAERFDPERFSDENKSKIVKGSYMPFGIGPRNCIGSRFALLEIKALVVSLLHEFNIVPVEKTQIPVKLEKSFTIEAKGGMWLGLEKRNS